MKADLLFYILMLFWLAFGIWNNWPAPGPSRNFRPMGREVLLFILILMLGWYGPFGAPLK